MATNGDIIAVAEAHTTSYLSALLSPDKITTKERADRMAAHYLPKIVFLTAGSISHYESTPVISAMIKSVLDPADSPDGLGVTELGHEIQAVEKDSALVWVKFDRKGKVFKNLYFFRRMPDGSVGWEGGNFDGESRVLMEMAAEEQH